MKTATQLKNLAKDSFIYGLSGIIIKLISLITFPIFANYFDPSAYGVIAVLSSLNLVLMTLSGIGLESASFRFFYDSEDTRYRDSVFSTWLIGRLAITLLLIVLTYLFLKGWLGQHFLDTSDGSCLITIVLINLVLNIIPSIMNTWFVIYKKASLSLLYSVCLAIISSGFSLLLVFHFKLGLAGFFLGQSGSFAVASLFGLLLYLFRGKKITFNKNLFWDMTRYGITVIPATLTNNLLLLLANLIILNLTDSNQLGIFQVGYTLSMIILFFTSGFSQAFVPYSLDLEEERFKAFCSIALDLYIGLIGAVCFISVIFYPELVSILLKPSYHDSIPVAGVLTFSSFISSIGTIASISFVKLKKVYYYGLTVFFSNVSNIILVYWLTSINGIYGASIAFLISNILQILVFFYLSNKLLPIPFNFNRNAITILIILLAYFLFQLYHEIFSQSVALKILLALLLTAFSVFLNRFYLKTFYHFLRNKN